jgi:hypothetical protein
MEGGLAEVHSRPPASLPVPNPFTPKGGSTFYWAGQLIRLRLLKSNSLRWSFLHTLMTNLWGAAGRF